MLEIIILSVIQGVTEFLPISSSAHLILVSKYLNFNTENLIIDLSLHSGSLLAVTIFFKKEILNFIKNKSLFFKIILSSLPTIVIGFLLVKFDIIYYLRNIYIIALTTILFGLLLYYSDKSEDSKKDINNLSLKDAFYIGLFQILSLIPGVSRAGVTITAARFLKYTRIESAKISFLLSIPTLFAVSSYSLIKLTKFHNFEITKLNIVATALSFIISYTTLKFFLKFLKKFSLIFFMFYRIFLGAVILIYAYIL